MSCSLNRNASLGVGILTVGEPRKIMFVFFTQFVASLYLRNIWLTKSLLVVFTLIKVAGYFEKEKSYWLFVPELPGCHGRAFVSCHCGFQKINALWHHSGPQFRTDCAACCKMCTLKLT